MTKRGEQTKKLFKNVVFMVASALVLIAATVAWFAKGNVADVSSVEARMGEGGSFDVEYYATDFYTMAGADGVATLAERQAASWSSANMNISSFYPGKYYSYKVVVTMDTDKEIKLDFKSITSNITVPQTLVQAILSAVRVDLIATNTRSGFTSESVSLSTTNLYALSSNSTALSTPQLENGDVLTIYFDVYMPGNDDSIDYDAIRESGAAVSVGEVVVS